MLTISVGEKTKISMKYGESRGTLYKDEPTFVYGQGDG